MSPSGQNRLARDHVKDYPMCCRNGRERHTATAAAITPGEQLQTMEAFEKEFSPKPGFYDPDVEVSPRVRAILVALDTP
jgi:hypothetical protein